MLVSETALYVTKLSPGNMNRAGTNEEGNESEIVKEKYRNIEISKLPRKRAASFYRSTKTDEIELNNCTDRFTADSRLFWKRIHFRGFKYVPSSVSGCYPSHQNRRARPRSCGKRPGQTTIDVKWPNRATIPVERRVRAAWRIRSRPSKNQSHLWWGQLVPRRRHRQNLEGNTVAPIGSISRS